MKLDKLTIKAQEALAEAMELASRSGHPEITPLHLLYAVATQEQGAVSAILQRVGVAPTQITHLAEEQLETLGHFIASHRSPERGAHGTTLSKSVGMALYDLTAATRIYYRALEKGIGTEVSMG